MPLLSRARASALASLFLPGSYSASPAGAAIKTARSSTISTGNFVGEDRGLLAREKRYRDEVFDRLEL